MNGRWVAGLSSAAVTALLAGVIATGAVSAGSPTTTTTTTTTTIAATTSTSTTTTTTTTTVAPTTTTTLAPAPGSVSITLERICDVGVELLRVSISATVDIAQGEHFIEEVPDVSDGLPQSTGPLAAGHYVLYDQVANVGHTYFATFTAQPTDPGAGTLTAESQITIERCPTPAGAPTVSLDVRCASPSQSGVILVTATNPVDRIVGGVIVELYAGQRASDTQVAVLRMSIPEVGSVSAEFDGLEAGRYVVSAFFPAGTANVYLEFLPPEVVDVPACADVGGAGGSPATLPATR